MQMECGILKPICSFGIWVLEVFVVIESRYSLNLSRQNGIKCFLGMLFEIDDMGKAEIKLFVAAREKRQLEDESSAQLMHLTSCFCVTFYNLLMWLFFLFVEFQAHLDVGKSKSAVPSFGRQKNNASVTTL